MQNSEVLEPNLFQSFIPALSMLQSLKNVSQKYIVIISDAEGAIVSDTDRSNELIGVFTDELIKNNIIPIVIAYTPDGREAMPNSRLLKRIVLNAGGAYYMAESSSAFQNVIQRDVYDYIFGQYIYEATLNTKGSKYLKPDEHQLEFEVITDRRTAKKKINWPKLK